MVAKKTLGLVAMAVATCSCGALVAAGAGAYGYAPYADTGPVAESYIDGEFHCWDGRTVFSLANGQTWRQMGYEVRYCERYNPRVAVYTANGGYTMSVEGIGMVDVERLW